MGRQGVRLVWAALPASVRGAIDEVLGSPVVETQPVSGGFSPDIAIRRRGRR